MHRDAHLDRLRSDLCRPGALGVPGPVEVVQTHASLVFLTPDEVFKVKKPVDFGFLDYSTLEQRAHFCREEVRVNRRGAPGVYLGVRTVIEGSDGRLSLGVEGPVVEHVVHMQRMPEAATLRHRLRDASLRPTDLAGVGRHLANFHLGSPRSEEATHHAHVASVAGNARDNLPPLRVDWLPPELVDALEGGTDRALERLRPVIEERAARACELHGDLRLEHVYMLDDRLVLLDAIEFNDAFRLGDPASDIAFLIMDLAAYGGWSHARELARAWLDEIGDHSAAAMLPFYVSYRSAVRAKVAVLSEPDAADPRAARARALRHLRLAVLALQTAETRPRLVLVSGLPGTGKTTLARALADRLGAAHIRTDVARKELAGLAHHDDASAAPGEGIYTPQMTARTYAACLDRARGHLEGGQPVFVDAGFRDEATRRPFTDLARELGLRFQLIVCSAPEEVVLARIAARAADASDADATIYRHLARSWESPDPDVTITVDTTSPAWIDEAYEALVADPF